MDPWEIAPGNEKDVSKKFAEASAKEQALMTKMIQENLDISNIYKTGSIIAIKKNSSIVKKNISVLQDGLRLDNQKSIKFDDEDYIILAIQKNGSGQDSVTTIASVIIPSVDIALTLEILLKGLNNSLVKKKTLIYNP